MIEIPLKWNLGVANPAPPPHFTVPSLFEARYLDPREDKGTR